MKHPRKEVSSHSPYSGRRCSITGRDIQSGDTIIVCPDTDIAYLEHAFREHLEHTGLCPACKKEAVIPPPISAKPPPRPTPAPEYTPPSSPRSGMGMAQVALVAGGVALLTIFVVLGALVGLDGLNNNTASTSSTQTGNAAEDAPVPDGEVVTGIVTQPPEPTDPPTSEPTPEPQVTREEVTVVVTQTPVPTDPPLPTEPPSPTPSPEPLSFPVDAVQSTLAQAGGVFGVVVYDLDRDEIIYAQNENEVFSAASLIKVPIALTAYYLADQGQLDLNEQITLTADQIVGGTGSLQYNQVRTTYTIRDLSARALYDSDNTAANMLLRRVGGFERVNALLTDLGMGQTQAQRYLMDFAALQAGRDNLTSPADMARMMRMITQNQVIGGQELLDAMGRTVDQQKIPALLPANAVVANKTGVLPAPDGVEHDISVIQLPDGNEYILVVMSKNLPNNQVAINAIAEASSLIYEYEQ